MAHGIRHHLERIGPPAYDGEALYPSGPRQFWPNGAVVWHHYVQLAFDRHRLEQKRAEATTQAQREALDALEQYWSAYRFGSGYTHSIPHFGRIVREGLDSYGDRIQAGLGLSQTNPHLQPQRETGKRAAAG